MTLTCNLLVPNYLVCLRRWHLIKGLNYTITYFITWSVFVWGTGGHTLSLPVLGKMAHLWQTTYSNTCTSKKMFVFWFKFHLKAVLIDNKSALVKVMAQCWTSDKSLHESMMTQFSDSYTGHQCLFQYPTRHLIIRSCEVLKSWDW